ncbi:MAG: two-component histidine kinase [Gemmatimonadetes bacterium]|jgi:heavy metal sensor kinase|nr:two-component histidine kinase [Gemmatimonadota bacterium]
MNIRSVRTRLALWHTAVLALVLVAFTIATYAFLDRLTRDRVDRSLAEAVRAFHQAVLAELRAHRTPEEAAQDAAQAFRFGGRRVLVYGAHHSLVAVSDSARDHLTQAISAVDQADDSPLHPIFASLTPGSSAYATIGEGSGGVRAYATSVQVADQTFTIVALQVGLSERSILATFLQATAIAIPLALVCAGLGGYFLARRSFAPVVDMGRRASAIDSESLDARLAVRNTGDEMDELATVFNDMLGRLERSFVQQRQFMADASHELRTPLASLRAEASVTLSQARTNHEYETSLEQVRDEARRLSAIVDDLFTIARLDAEDHILQRQEFYLEEVVMQCVGRLHSLAQDRGLSLTFLPSVEARCSGDPDLVDRIITNLLDNATKYTPRGGSVRIELERAGDRHLVRVSDDGTGIPLEAQSRVFDRFFRADEARTRPATRTGGAGLGLSIAWRIARAHGGDLVLTSSNGQGSVFTLTLPAA